MAALGIKFKPLIPEEVKEIFNRYATEADSKRMPEAEALQMLQNEFGLSQPEAKLMFDSFDKDQNKVMSIWEFKQFYEIAGENASAAIKRFHELDVDGSGKLDPEEAQKAFAILKTGSGRNLNESEIDFFMQTSKDEEGLIDIATFTNLLRRLKMYNPAV